VGGQVRVNTRMHAFTHTNWSWKCKNTSPQRLYWLMPSPCFLLSLVCCYW